MPLEEKRERKKASERQKEKGVVIRRNKTSSNIYCAHAHKIDVPSAAPNDPDLPLELNFRTCGTSCFTIFFCDGSVGDFAEPDFAEPGVRAGGDIATGRLAGAVALDALALDALDRFAEAALESLLDRTRFALVRLGGSSDMFGLIRFFAFLGSFGPSSGTRISVPSSKRELGVSPSSLHTLIFNKSMRETFFFLAI